MRFAPQLMIEVRRCLAHCPADMPVNIEPGILIDAQTVGELRCLPSWPNEEVEKAQECLKRLSL